jgi:hypothetical protein
MINTGTLKTRVKGAVRFTHFRDGNLYYATDDGWEFPVDVAETTNKQGNSPTFKAQDKGIVFMRWIRKHMETEAEWRESRD